VYFRLTESGVVMIGLHSDAPVYVGFRTEAAYKGHVLKPSSAAYSLEDATRRWKAFEAWHPSVRRRSVEEQGVIPIIRSALGEHLHLYALGDGWLFLC